MLTIAYFTSRREPRIEWFFSSLERETGGNYDGIKVVVIDFWAKQRPLMVESNAADFAPVYYSPAQHIPAHGGQFVHTTPKPTVWQGEHRLTKEDYFAASNARNTAIAHAPDGWIAFVDDLSVLLPGWLAAVRTAMENDYIVLGAYKKQKQLVVDDFGSVVSFEAYPGGIDSRWDHGSDSAAVVAAGSWMFGCSLAAPVRAFLDINGFDECLDSIGMEDCAAGMMLERAGYSFRYDRRMLTYESEEDHAQLPVFRRLDKGQSPNDSSHAFLKLLQNGRRRAPNFFGEEGLAGLRDKILAGEPFPICQIPEHHWFDGQPLREM